VSEVTTFTTTESRQLIRCWPLLGFLPLAAVVAGLMLHRNADVYLDLINYDPQGAEQDLDGYRTDARSVYTSGLGWACLMALAAGSSLGRGATIRSLLPRALGAAVFGLTLAGAALMVVLPNAAGQLADHWAIDMLVQDHGPAATTGPLGPTMLGAVACVALAGVIGAGLGGLGLRGWVGWIVAALSAVGVLGLASGPALLGHRVLFFVLVPLALVPLLTMELWVSGFAPAAAVVLLVFAGVTLGGAAVSIAVRKPRMPRLPRMPPAALPGGSGPSTP
jgi:hypothetical protein